MSDILLLILFSSVTLAMAVILGLWIIIRAVGGRTDPEPEVNEGALEGDLQNFVINLNTERGR